MHICLVINGRLVVPEICKPQASEDFHQLRVFAHLSGQATSPQHSVIELSGKRARMKAFCLSLEGLPYNGAGSPLIVRTKLDTSFLESKDFCVVRTFIAQGES